MSYHTETYPTSIDVRVTFHDSAIGTDSFEDGIKGWDVDDALARAAWNWPGATITYLSLNEEDSRGLTPTEIQAAKWRAESEANQRDPEGWELDRPDEAVENEWEVSPDAATWSPELDEASV